MEPDDREQLEILDKIVDATVSMGRNLGCRLERARPQPDDIVGRLREIRRVLVEINVQLGAHAS